MPRGFMDDLEGEVIGEEIHEGTLGDDILSVYFAYRKGKFKRRIIPNSYR